eukprot:gene3933-14010_t
MDPLSPSASPLDGLVQEFHSRLNLGLKQLSDFTHEKGLHPQAIQGHLSGFSSRLKHGVASNLQQLQGSSPVMNMFGGDRSKSLHSPRNRVWMPMTASISMGNFWQPMYEIAMPKDEVKARLAPIAVYTVANPKNEFVLVAGENDSQLGFFFFNRDDAEAIVDKIREENPRLARDSKILRVTMDNVYEVFTTPRDVTGLQGIHFRFMPDMKQVEHALSLYHAAGVPTNKFIGVPVFQAEGLTVTTQEMQYVPLFLCKEDLDVAVQSAYKQRNAAQIKVYRDKANKYEDEYNQVAGQAVKAKGREKSSLESRTGKAKQKMELAKDKAESVEKAPMPKIEVGSFEEVIMRMTGSSGEEQASWSQVMFVAPKLLQQNVKDGDSALPTAAKK